ncbi:MAG TPA: class I SAM-dependent methyltransferase [Saprospiraceae bacterium]|nr:class I SAM-dependent methyltransferase [Saprospiraceae bacterium]
MTLTEAIDLIRPGVTPISGTWADIGAGTGLFTEALIEILEEGKIIAVDKSPHSLYSNRHLISANKQLVTGKRQINIEVEIVEADFNLPLNLPPLDGILMANALHYANNHIEVLRNVLASLKPNGTFILIEYDTDKPNPPWVPNPVPLERFQELCRITGLKEPEEIGRRKSIYQDGEIYAVTTKRV